MKYRELWFTSPGKVELKIFNPENTKTEDFLIKAEYSLISSGTERLLGSGSVSEKIYDEMKVPYMKGDFSFPFTYGYSLVGEIIKGEKSMIGKHVHILHPHAEIAQVCTKDVYFLPEGYDIKSATFASNMETVVNAVWDSGVSIGDKVLIAGFGLIGSLLAGVLRSMKYIDIFIIENDADRLKIAAKSGFKILNAAMNENFDYAFNSSANAAGLQACIDSVGLEGKVVELSWYGDKQIRLNLGGDFHSKRKQIIASQVSHLPAKMLPRWDFLRRKNLVFEILKDDYFLKLPVLDIPFSDCPGIYENNIKINQFLGVRIKY